MHTIETVGISGTEGGGQVRMQDPRKVRRRIDALFNKPNLTFEDVVEDAWPAATFACGTEFGAKYYACMHNYSRDESRPGEPPPDYPIMVEFTAPIDEVYVDSRDFLCTAFQFSAENPGHGRRQQADILTQVFGPAIRRYFSAAARNPTDYAIGMCNLAAMDEDVLKAHLANTKVIRGRHKTRFKSAFFVKAPIPPERIVQVRKPRLQKKDIIGLMKPDIELRDFYKLRELEGGN